VEAVQKIKLDPVGLSGMGIASETTGEREPRRTVKWESEVVKQCRDVRQPVREPTPHPEEDAGDGLRCSRDHLRAAAAGEVIGGLIPGH
jgi:hypothetical protein